MSPRPFICLLFLCAFLFVLQIEARYGGRSGGGGFRPGGGGYRRTVRVGYRRPGGGWYGFGYPFGYGYHFGHGYGYYGHGYYGGYVGGWLITTIVVSSIMFIVVVFLVVIACIYSCHCWGHDDYIQEEIVYQPPSQPIVVNVEEPGQKKIVFVKPNVAEEKGHNHKIPSNLPNK